MNDVTDLVRALRAGLADLADPQRAVAMRAYMKSEMPFYGVPSPPRRTMVNAVLAAHPLPDRPTWLTAVRTLWTGAQRREERYVAIDLLGRKPYARWRAPDMLPLYEDMIVTGAWWDHVDEIAIRHVGALRTEHPQAVAPAMRAWATDADRWKRRTSVICQVTAKANTDTDLLTHCVESTQDDPDFFLRKGIGWALRDYARTAPDWVRDFVATHPRLSPLSRREATKHL
jgi:3-methyladenine DNA glycosylase AlkD